jgi:galactose mutarotase-like enzyme
MSRAVRTYETVWLGQPALALETASLLFITVPGMGAKIVSLFNKRTGREWLLPPVNRGFEPVAYGASFVDQDMSGWDEMFPTINACQYPVEGIYKDKGLPDHGEVWTIRWQIDFMTDDTISVLAVGRALPYRLTRTSQATDDQRVRLTFEAVNTGREPLVALWAAHPQFIVNGETRIRLPESVKRVVNVHPTQDWGEVSQTYSWPEAQAQNGNWLRLDHIGTPDLRNCRKFYVLPDQPVSWAALQQGSDGDWVRLSWDAERVPYLGIWVDEGTFNAAPTVALEPTTGFYDSLDLASQNNQVMHLRPGEPVRWYIDIQLGNGMLEMSGQ